MIKLDISIVIFLYLFSTVIVVLLLWILMTKSAKIKASHLGRKGARGCSICSHVYIDTEDEEFSRCPQCKNMNKKEKSAQK